MNTKKEYHDNEMRRYHARVAEVGKQSRQDTAEAKGELLKCWNEYPHVFGERVGWLLNGSYGYGEMITALRIADNKNPRFNRVAALSQILALCEWSTPASATISAFKSLPAEKQKELNALVQAELDYFDANREEFEPVEGV